jgi:hypothetical protein
MAIAFLNVISKIIVNDALTRIKRQPGFLPIAGFIAAFADFSSFIFANHGPRTVSTMPSRTCAGLAGFTGFPGKMR